MVWSFASTAQVKKFAGIPLNVDSILAMDIRLIPSPVLYRTPETNWAFGAGLLYYFPSEVDSGVVIRRASNLNALVEITQKKQYTYQLSWNVFTKAERYYLWGNVGYVKFFDRFYGVGNDLENEFETYDFERNYLTLRTFKNFGKSVFAGLQVKYQHMYQVKAETGNILNSSVFGADGSYNVGIGPSLRLDRRNHAYVATKGYLLDISTYFHPKGALNSHVYQQISVDYRLYKTVFKKSVVALQLHSVFNSGDVPFRFMAILGGEDLMRGYFRGRFRDNNSLILQAEYRLPIYKLLGANFFMSTGQVAENLGAYNWNNFKASLGTGLRFKINKVENLGLRIDYAKSLDNRNGFFYFGVNEVF